MKKYLEPIEPEDNIIVKKERHFNEVEQLDSRLTAKFIWDLDRTRFPNAIREECYKNGNYHNLNGPALVWDNQCEYWVNGERHRKDGWAITWLDVNEKKWDFGEYWFNGRFLPDENVDLYLNLGYSIEVAIKLAYLVQINKK